MRTLPRVLLRLSWFSAALRSRTYCASSAADSLNRFPPPMSEVLQVKRLSETAVLPVRGSADAAGFDLASAQHVVIPAKGKAIVPTDLSIACPPQTYARIAPRSGLAVKKFIDVGAGVVDADYRGPVGVVLFNFGEEDFAVKPGDRVAQLVLERICMAPVAEVAELSETQRGAGGFGSTGVAGPADGDSKVRVVSPTPAQSADGTVERMRALATMKEEGLITEAEFEEKKAAIMAGL